MTQCATALPCEQTGRTAPPALATQRLRLKAAIETGGWQTEPPPVAVTVGGMRALRFLPEGPSLGVLVHFHGGAFRIGAPEFVAGYACALARRTGLTVLCPAYRLAPEHPFPSALLDGMAVLRAVREAEAGPLLISGDSAGGGLAASLTALALPEGLSPDGLILLSPWLDLTVTAGSYRTNATTDLLFSQVAAEEAAAFYLGQVDASDPLASPLFGAVGNFPPTLINVGDGEVLLDDARNFHTRLCAAGVRSTLGIIAGMQHVAVTSDLSLPGSAETFEAVIGFLSGTLRERQARPLTARVPRSGVTPAGEPIVRS